MEAFLGNSVSGRGLNTPVRVLLAGVASLSLGLACTDAGAIYYSAKKTYLNNEKLSFDNEYFGFDVFSLNICHHLNKKRIKDECVVVRVD